MLGSKSFFEVITTVVNVSPGELLMMILKFSTLHHLPHTVTSKLITLINTVFENPILPQSRYMLDKLFNPKDEAVFYFVCSDCGNHIGKLEDFDTSEIAQCKVCKKQYELDKPSCENLFLMINPSTAIKEIIQANEEYYDDVVTQRHHEKNHLKDIFDGKKYREFTNSLPPEDKNQYATISFNTDGAAPFKSSKYSAWPVYLMVHEIPPQERFSNLITCGIWFNKKKPNMTVFLDPMVDIMNELEEKGIMCTIKEENRQIKVYTLVCCVDTVARGPIQGISQFNAKCSCNWCLNQGEHIGSMRYIVENNVPDRNAKDTITLMNLSVDPTYVRTNGVNHVSALINLVKFDIIEGFVPDYMHCCLAGVAKQIMNLILKPSDVAFFQNLMQQIKFPHQIRRLTRPLSDRKYWKCREFENFSLYNSIPILSLRIERYLIEYWSLFVESLYILLQADITYEELETADQKLHEFVFKTEQYFGKTAMTYNVHQLLHLSKSVLNWGPLWAHSCFAFENGNHHMLQAINSANGVIYQILRHVNINRAISVLETRIFPGSSEAVKTYCTLTLKSKVKKSIKVSTIRYFGKGVKIAEKVATHFNVSSSCKTYIRMVKDGCLYASSLKVNIRSDNSVAQLIDGSFVIIEKFIVDVDNKKEFTTCYKISDCNHGLCSNYNVLRKIRSVGEDPVIISTKDIKVVCVLITIRNDRYVCPLPNLLFY